MILVHLLPDTENLRQAFMHNGCVQGLAGRGICSDFILVAIVHRLGLVIDGRVVENNGKFTTWVMKWLRSKDGSLAKPKCRGRAAWVPGTLVLVLERDREGLAENESL